MKNNRALVMLVLSLLIGIAAVVMAARWINEKAAISTTGVVVAAKDIPLGSRLAPEQMKVVAWPASSTPTGAFRDEQKVVSRVVNTSIMAGEPILENKLAPVGSKGGLSALLASGTRAISVKVNEVVGVAGFALPGNYVDILVNAQDEGGKPVSKIVLQRILVLAVAQESDRDETKPKIVNAVTLQVTPEQAEKLDLARSVGQLSLILRNQVDVVSEVTEGARLSDLVEDAPIVTLPTPAEVSEAEKKSSGEKPKARPAPKHITVAKPAAPLPTDKPARPAYVEGVQVAE